MRIKTQDTVVTDGIVPSSVRWEIVSLLHDVTKKYGLRHIAYTEGEFDWRVNPDENTPKLTTRISKYMHDHHQVDLGSITMGKIGEMISHHAVHECDYKLAHYFRWKAGNFDDGGSCYWGEYASARDTMRDDNRFGSVRIYKPGTRAGIARCWTFRDVYNRVVLFNGYGMSTMEIASVLAFSWGADHVTRVGLMSDGDYSSRLYINGGSGILIHEENHPPVHTIDMMAGYRNAQVRCVECGGIIPSGKDKEIVWVSDTSPMCEHCMGDKAARCVSCNEYKYLDDLDSNELCARCLSVSVEGE